MSHEWIGKVVNIHVMSCTKSEMLVEITIQRNWRTRTNWQPIDKDTKILNAVNANLFSIDYKIYVHRTVWAFKDKSLISMGSYLKMSAKLFIKCKRCCFNLYIFIRISVVDTLIKCNYDIEETKGDLWQLSNKMDLIQR